MIMRILNLMFATLLLTVPICQQQTKGWRGIVPLHSTKADVIRLWGEPNIDGRLYEIDNYRVFIDYSDGPCVKGRSGWNVPRDTVVSISLAPNKDLKFSELHIDEKRFKKSNDGELSTISYYTDETAGVTISVSDGEVRNIFYNPTSKDNSLRCPTGK
jgi:hypothetical protein